jgi:hypothetical protein
MLQVNVGSVYSSGDQGLASTALRESFGKTLYRKPSREPTNVLVGVGARAKSVI